MFEIMTIIIESKLLNQSHCLLYHSFQKTMFYLMKLKYVIFSNIKVTKIERSAFIGTPGTVKSHYTIYNISVINMCMRHKSDTQMKHMSDE